MQSFMCSFGALLLWSLLSLSTADRVELQKSELQTLLEETIGNEDVLAEMTSVEASMSATYRSLPKNAEGRITAAAMRHIIQVHLLSEHGWLLLGLQPESLWQETVRSPWEISIFQSRAPRSLLKELESYDLISHGASFGEVVAFTVLLKQLVLHELMEAAEAAYVLNKHAISDSLSKPEVREVLASFLVLLRSNWEAIELDAKDIVQKKVSLFNTSARNDSGWQDSYIFVDNVMGHKSSFGKNAFVNRYPWEPVWHTAQQMIREYGYWQNEDCEHMMKSLMSLDRGDTGRVILGHFYSDHKQKEYMFRESEKHLKDIGALDDSVPGSPKVLSTNYVYSSSNAKLFFGKMAFMCMNSCSKLMNAVEMDVQSPFASPKHLVQLVHNLRARIGTPMPQSLASLLEGKLFEIAGKYGGEVPLHGRLFAQWLHFAFPFDCPYPQLEMREDSFPTPSVRKEHLATKEELTWHLQRADGAWHMDAPLLSQWRDETTSRISRPSNASVNDDMLNVLWPADVDKTMHWLLLVMFAAVSFSTGRRAYQSYCQHVSCKAEQAAKELLLDEAKANSTSDVKKTISSKSSNTPSPPAGRFPLSKVPKETRSNTSSVAVEASAAPRKDLPKPDNVPVKSRKAEKKPSRDALELEQGGFIGAEVCKSISLDSSTSCRTTEDAGPSSNEGASLTTLEDAALTTVEDVAMSMSKDVALVTSEDVAVTTTEDAAPRTSNEADLVDVSNDEHFSSSLDGDKPGLEPANSLAEEATCDDECSNVTNTAAAYLHKFDLLNMRFRGHVKVWEESGFGLIESRELFSIFKCDVFVYSMSDCHLSVGQPVVFNFFRTATGQLQAQEVLSLSSSELNKIRPPPGLEDQLN
jgi:hypothetical protein